MKSNNINILSVALLSTGMLFATSSFSGARAGTFTGSDATRAASAAFEAVGTSQLKITLSNTSTGDVTVPVDVLTGVFFKLNYPNLTGLTLNAVSATLTAGYQAVNNNAAVASGSNVSNGWAYNGNTGSRGNGISAAGLGLFGPSNVIGTDSNGVQGLDYGLLSAGDNIATGNGGVKGAGNLYKSGVSFLFNVVAPAGSSYDINTVVNSISSVGFQYGTATTEPYIVSNNSGGSTVPTPSADGGPTPAVPEPAEIGGVALAALILGSLKLKMSKRVKIS